MGDLTNEGESQWVCPNDRQLILRAKLKAGWSYHSNSPVRKSPKSLISEEEQDMIKQTLEQAEKLQQMEQERICRLVEKLENMQNNALGDGVETCLLCNSKFGVLKMVARKCDICAKSVCDKCGVDTLNSKGRYIWLCMLCSEHREMWKKTGAWFYRAIPNHTCPQNSQSAERKSTVGSINSYPLLMSASTFGWDKRSRSKESLNENVDAPSESDDESDSSSDEFTKKSDGQKRSVSPLDDFGYRPSVDMSATPGGKLLESIDTPPLYRKRSQMLIAEDRQRAPSQTSSTSNASSSSATDSIHGESSDSVKPSRRDTAEDEDIDELFKNFKGSSTPEDCLDGSGFGILEFTLVYDRQKRKLDITIASAKNLKAMDLSGRSDPYVKLHLLPGASKRNKLRTHTKHKTLDPVFNETLTYHGTTEEQLAKKTLRLQVFDEDTLGHNNFIGETSVALRLLQSKPTQTFRRNLVEQACLDHGVDSSEDILGRIELSLIYQTQKGTLKISIVRCAGLAAMDTNGYSDPYVKCYLKPDPHKKSKRRTSVKKKTLNPEFYEEFIYEIAHSELVRKTLEVTVWDHDVGRSNDFIGGVILDMKAKGTALQHWYEMLKTPNQSHTCWHTLEKITPNPE